jgi:polar amino acid transport system substrate-binding protein
MKFIQRHLPLCLVIFATVSTASAENARRTLVVASGFNEAPYAFFSEDGKPSGFDVDLIRAVANAAGMDVTFKTSGAIEEPATDIVVGARYSDRGQPGIARYCEPHTVRDHAVFVRKDSLYRNLRDLAGRTLVAPSDSTALPWLEKHGFGPITLSATTLDDAFQRLEQNDGEAVICDRYQGLAALSAGRLADLRLLPDSVVPAEYGFALTSEEPALSEALNAGLTVVRNTGQFERIRGKWLAGLDPVPGRISLGGAYSVLLWLVIPGVLLCIGATISTLSFRKRSTLRIAELEKELAESRQAFRDLVNERARQRYVINQLSTVSLVDQIAEASRH